MFSVDIDVGGTLTDGIFSDGQTTVWAKVDTTTHDLTVCLFDCLQAGAAQLGFPDVASFLEQVELLRWSTTITSNVLAERHGPKIGLIVSKGHERDLYGREAQSPLVNYIVDGRDIVGIDQGEGAEVLSAVRSLLEGGVRRICISLQGALQNPEPELHIKKTIQEQYPDHFLGSVPALAGSEICQNVDDMTRTHYAAINAYTHSALASTLFKAEDELRYTHGYNRAFLVSHINGGVAGVSKTRAVDTIESGPVLGLYGTCYLARLYGLAHVIALDVGGTTAKIGIVDQAEPVYTRAGDLFGIPVQAGLPFLRSTALGGGSVAAVAKGEVQLGPESMGAFPGPVCYGLGGDKPTLTDAFVSAGLIDPEYFLGGSRHLDIEAARTAIRDAIANPLGIAMEDACRAIVNRAFDMVASMIAAAAQELERDLSDYTLFAYGGNGGLFACAAAERAGLENVLLFGMGPVFSAFGSSVTDISHVYERSLRSDLVHERDFEVLNRYIAEMSEAGVRDLRGEGISPDGAICGVELEFSRPDGSAAVVRTSQLHFTRGSFESMSPELSRGNANLDVIRLRIKKGIARPAMFRPESRGTDESSTSQKGAHPMARAIRSVDASATRRISYGSSKGEAAVYRWESLAPGSEVRGCALLESPNSTYFVPEGWRLEMDEYGNAKLFHIADNRKTVQKNAEGGPAHARRRKTAHSRH